MSVTDQDKAKSFLEFEYAEIKDISKQFLTVVAAVLALSVTFAEKIADFENASSCFRMLIVSAWVLNLFSFVLGGVAIFFVYNAGACAKNTLLYNQEKYPFRSLSNKAHGCLFIAGVLFVVALLLLVVSGITRVY